MVNTEDFLVCLSDLCGKEIPTSNKKGVLKRLRSVFKMKKPTDSFSFRQLNEILLLCNERIVSEEFFTFLASEGKQSKNTMKFSEFTKKVLWFRKLAMLQFGSFRFAYNFLSMKKDIVSCFEHSKRNNWLKKPRDLIKELKSRSDSMLEITPIEEKYLDCLGYLTPKNIPKKKLKEVKRIGCENFETYLTYDYIDVYVATSMRESWEFKSVSRLCKQIFESDRFQSANIRYFDPTLNFNKNSIAKSLIEGLMLRRAKCTLYLVQEADTIGKDSEMSATLAQGKPVIAYVPTIDVKKRIKELKHSSQDSISELLHKTHLLKQSSDNFANPTLEKRISELADMIIPYVGNKNELRKMVDRINELCEIIANAEVIFYNKRAETLINFHPLRFQIDLESGVANGIMVTRTPQQCKKVIYEILTNQLEFDIINPSKKRTGKLRADDLNYRLVERETGCAFRVVTEDETLANSFWNLYLLGGN